MYNYFPLIAVGASIGIFSIAFIVAYALIKDKKTELGFDRNMKDTEIVKRLLVYAKPHAGSFIAAGIVTSPESQSLELQSRLLLKNKSENISLYHHPLFLLKLLLCL